MTSAQPANKARNAHERLETRSQQLRRIGQQTLAAAMRCQPETPPTAQEMYEIRVRAAKLAEELADPVEVWAAQNAPDEAGSVFDLEMWLHEISRRYMRAIVARATTILEM